MNRPAIYCRANTERETTIQTHSKFRIANKLKVPVFGRKSEYMEITHTDMGKRCKLQTD